MWEVLFISVVNTYMKTLTKPQQETIHNLYFNVKIKYFV
jgi:hypothetical protein